MVYFNKSGCKIKQGVLNILSCASHLSLDFLSPNYILITCNIPSDFSPDIAFYIFNQQIQGVTGGTDQTSEECSLGHTIPI